MRLWKVLLINACVGLMAMAAEPPGKAKNVILFLADAGGIPTLNAASIVAYDAPQKLYVQSWQYVGLSDTTPSDGWVTDSAAGMTAIMTGHKTHNGVISESADAVRGKSEGAPLKTLLEYAEERGLSTGAITNVLIADATPAACFAHTDDRNKHGEIFMQIFSPKFGDGVDVVFGSGRSRIYAATKALGVDLDEVAKSKGRPVWESLDQVPADAKRAIAVTAGEIDLPAAARKAISILSRNPKGYFLMVEYDAHTDHPRAGINRLIAFDKLIRELSESGQLKDTLLVFTADHSFDLRVHSGGPGKPLLEGLKEWEEAHPGKTKDTIRLPYVRVDDSHTGEEVLVTAKGPGAERVHGFMPNTEIFHIMMAAYGWEPAPASKH